MRRRKRRGPPSPLRPRRKIHRTRLVHRAVSMSERSEHEVMINGIPSTVMLTDDEAANWFPIPTKPAAAPESADPEIATLAPDTGVVDAEAVVSVTGSSFVDGSAVEVD